MVQFSSKILKIIPFTYIAFVRFAQLDCLCIWMGMFFMKEIMLPNKGKITLVDDDEYERLNQYVWKCKINKHTSYAYRTVCQITIWMHKDILGIPPNSKLRGDHKDFNGLNNQKYNLRVATHAQNNCYKNSAKNSTSKYLGVCLHRKSNRWRACITKDYKQMSLGYFTSETDAALAYNKAAIKYHGEFANLNVIS